MKCAFQLAMDIDSFGLIDAERDTPDGPVRVGDDETLPAGTTLLLDPDAQRSAFVAHVRAGDLVKVPLISKRNEPSL